MNTYEKYAIIIGVILNSENKVSLTKVNNLAEQAGEERLKNKELQDLYSNVISEDKHLNDLLEKAIKGEIGLPDISTEFESNDYTTYTPPYIVGKEEQMARMREFRKVMKDGSYLDSLIRGLKVDLESVFDDFEPVIAKRPEKVDYDSSDKVMIMALSDLHVGLNFSDTQTRGYNFEVLKDRLEQYKQQVIQEIIDNDIIDIRIYFVGDLIEHINMRNVNQAYETEFTMSKQIALGTRLLADIIKEMSVYGDVTFHMIHGNHDRMQGNKNDKVYNDSAAYIALDMLLYLQEVGAFGDNVDIVNNKNDIYKSFDIIEMNGLEYKVALIHGDTTPKNGHIIPKVDIMNNTNMVITGHLHHFAVFQESFDKLHVRNSSTIGTNNFSKELNLGSTTPSQTRIILNFESESTLYSPDIKPVFLD